MLEEIDRLKLLYREWFREEVYIPKYNEGAECADEMKKMRLGVDSGVFLEKFLNIFPWKVVSTENCDIHDFCCGSYRYRTSDMYAVHFKIPIWTRLEDVVSTMKNKASESSRFSTGDLDCSHRDRIYVHVRIAECLNEEDLDKYNALDKKYNDVQWELECLDRSYDKQIRDWEIECIERDELMPFCFDSKDIEL